MKEENDIVNTKSCLFNFQFFEIMYNSVPAQICMLCTALSIRDSSLQNFYTITYLEGISLINWRDGGTKSKS